MWNSLVRKNVEHPLEKESAATDRVLETYLHGLFENGLPREAFVANLFIAGKKKPKTPAASGRLFDVAADLLEENLDLEWIS